MEIKNLQHTNIEMIYEAFHKAFLNYFFPLSESFEETIQRWELAGVNLNISYGAFDDDQLVAFILNAHVDATIFHFTMGVIPEYRGKNVIEMIYPFIPKDVKRYRLEVLSKNTQAVNLYHRLGFETKRILHCYEGTFSLSKLERGDFHYEVKPLHRNSAFHDLSLFLPATESQFETLQKNNHHWETHEIRVGKKLVAYAQFGPQELSLKEVGALEPVEEHLDLLFSSMKLQGEKIQVINIEERALEFSEYLKKRGLRNSFTQLEMEKAI